MPLGKDAQYDLSSQEQDKYRRRMEIKNRLKLESIKKKYDPFLMMKEIIYSDPANLRYQDLRKKGRMPGAPFKPQLFFTLVGSIFIPFFLVAYATNWERKPWLAAIECGDLPISERMNRSVV